MKDQYKHIADWYDRIFESLNSGLRNIGMKIYPVKAGMNVLDIGCGTGALLRMYQKEKCNIFGIDLSAAMLKVARKKLGDDADLKLCDATDTCFPDSKFDLILSSTVLHEMSQQVRVNVLKEAKRILKKDGRILLIDFHPGPLKKIKGVISKIIITIAETLAGGEHYINYRQFIKNGGLPSLIKSTEFEVEAQKIVGGGTFGMFLLKK
ncbi:MAG: methyltransferase domain-containing protein [Pseudomonadota bacterium]